MHQVREAGAERAEHGRADEAHEDEPAVGLVEGGREVRREGKGRDEGGGGESGGESGGERGEVS